MYCWEMASHVAYTRSQSLSAILVCVAFRARSTPIIDHTCYMGDGYGELEGQDNYGI